MKCFDAIKQASSQIRSNPPAPSSHLRNFLFAMSVNYPSMLRLPPAEATPCWSSAACKLAYYSRDIDLSCVRIINTKVFCFDCEENIKINIILAQKIFASDSEYLLSCNFQQNRFYCALTSALTHTAQRCRSETKNNFRGSFQFSIVTIQKISPPWKPEIQ